MNPELRRLYNAAFSQALYRRYVDRLETWLDVKIPFRIAESPLFLPKALRAKLATSAREIVAQISRPELIEKMKAAIPPALDVPRRDSLASCIQVDFAIVRGEDGELTGKVVELQGFPSLYALMVVQSEAMAEELKTIPGLEGPWSIFYSGHDRRSFVAKFKEALLDGHEPEEVVLLDLDPPAQKTYADFVATRQLTGVESIGPEEIVREGLRLFRKKGGRKVQIKRIFNRVVFDELSNKGVELPFDYREDLDVSWFPHPNWYWLWSKYTLPHVDHHAVPKATYVSDLRKPPEDLSRYVLKPLFSFAGSGVKIDPTQADLDAIPENERAGWILQEKIVYEPALPMPSGEGVKAEVRMMFIRGPRDENPELVLNLVRMSRGKMLGVDQNKNFDWVGGSIGIWPEAEGSV
ncbi:MAG: hypothetical protein HYV09_19680 [Deltaproteobacteria bacterium]|nr:hypothetical protein [Deltaproteobacteria bacterium]